MKQLIALIIALGFVTVAQAGVNQFGDRANLVNLYPIAPVTTSTPGSAVDLVSYSGVCAALLDVSAPVSGTNPTLAVKLLESATSGGSYTDVVGGGFTSSAADALAQKIVFNKDEKMRFMKLGLTIGGTDAPQYLVSSKIVCDKKYR